MPNSTDTRALLERYDSTVEIRMRIGSLFSGIGGLELGLEWAGVGHTVWQVERDKYCQSVLAHHWPDATRYDDVCTVGAHNLAPVDVICGGFPCQPHSVAGLRKASRDDRDLWAEYERIISELRPSYVIAENVPGLLTSERGRFFNRILSGLHRIGYDVEWHTLSAAEVGAPHRRQRIFIIAWLGDPHGGRREQRDAGLGECRESDSRHVPVGDTGSAGWAQQQLAAKSGHSRHTAGERGRVGDTASARCEASIEPSIVCESRPVAGRGCCVGDTDDTESTRLGLFCGDGPTEAERHGEAGIALGRVSIGRAWADAIPVRGADGTVRLIPHEAATAGPQSPLWPVADGAPGRVARLRAIGNAVVPQCAEVIGKRLLFIHQRKP